MDFLEIRKKAKERSAAAAQPPANTSPSPSPSPSPSAPPSPSSSPRTPDPDASPVPELPAVEGQFVTWRPGTAARAVPAAPPEPSRRRRGDGAAPTPPTPGDPLDAFFYRADEDESALAAIGAPIEAARAPAAAPLEEYLTFTLGDERYGVRIGAVREVLKAPAITEVPRAPAHVLGVVTVRGEVVAVFDPRRRLALPGAPRPDGRIVIVDAGEGPCGLLVDAVSSVVRLPAGAIEPCPQGISGAHADCFTGIGRERDTLFTVVDAAALVRAPPRRGEGRAHGLA